jgi:segregation and condensation protein B
MKSNKIKNAEIQEGIIGIVESLIFASSGPLSVARIEAILKGRGKPRQIEEALHSIQVRCQQADRGLELQEVAGGWQFRTKPQNAQYVMQLQAGRAVSFSSAALETLAIVAYRQPITAREIQKFRKVESASGVLSTLRELDLIKTVGRKKAPGNPFLFGTTKKFLEVFNLHDLAALPPLKEQATTEPPTLAEPNQQSGETLTLSAVTPPHSEEEQRDDSNRAPSGESVG